MTTDTTLAPCPTEREQFEAWWEREGQFCRAGGGNYEKTFAYRAWQAARAQAPAPQGPAAELQQALETLETDAHLIFNNPPGEATQAVRDVIEWYAGSIRVAIGAAHGITKGDGNAS